MTPTLESLAPCWQGLIPATLYTCSRDGVPNAAYLSHVEYVDERHVALSFQFFNKSRRNVAENPQALVRVIDPDSSQCWALRLSLVRSETSGPVFERMDLRIEAIASYTGVKGIFKLLAADIYEVQAIEPVADDVGGVFEAGGEARPGAADARFTMRALQDMTERVNGAACLDVLLDSILAGLEEIFGFRHAMLLVPAEEPGVLVTIASRGYGDTGVGAEARLGEGIVGLVAEARKPIRISGLLRAMLYAHAVATRAQQSGMAPPPRIPLPGLASPASQLGVPLMVRGELVGVLCIESEEPYRFHEEDKASIELLGSYLAIAIQNMQLQERAEADVPVAAVGPAAPAAPPSPVTARPREIVYYEGDELVMVDGEYLIRSLPARILWKLLAIRTRDGRAEFTNRELRLDKSLNLPELKDNLESRLLLLRRRLEQKTPDIRLVPRARGRFALDLGCEVRLRTLP
ncbi:MAG: GAF domain-containing protein [Vicinamibacterales bacterium]